MLELVVSAGLHWFPLAYVTFEDLGDGIGHVLEVGGAVTMCSMSVGTGVILSSKVLSRCDCLF